MNAMITVILAVQMLSALAMIGLILVQQGKGADMGAAFGSGASGSLFGATGSANFLSRITAALASGSQMIASYTVSMGQNALDLVVGFFVMLYLAFFLLRDGTALSRRIRAAVPLAPVHRQHLAAKFINFNRCRVNFHSQARCSFINQVNCFIWQLARWNVAIGKICSGNKRSVCNCNFVVRFVALFKPSQNCDCVHHARLPNIHLLKTTLECWVFLNAFTVLIQGGGTNQTQFASCQHRL